MITYSYNEYDAILYGKSSMIIKKNGREILHTYSRQVNDQDEVIEMLKEMPEFEKLFGGAENAINTNCL